jgi:hypothetical protein
MAIDFEGLAARLLSDSRSILESWFPAGKWRGREFVVGNLSGDPGESLSINSASGLWKDFASGESGGDLISLHAARTGMTQVEAAMELGAQDRPNRNGHAKPKSAVAREPICVPPQDEQPSLVHPDYGRPIASWAYHNAAGEVIGHVARYDPPGSRKQLIPWTYSGKAWIRRQFPEPRPLYGLELLDARPTAAVMLVEGEKTTDAARLIAGATYVVVTWPGGCQAWRKTDFSPLYGREVLCVPDADLQEYPKHHPEAGKIMPYEEQPGQSTMLAIAKSLVPHCPKVKIINVAHDREFQPPDGWDLADAAADGWGWAEFREWATLRISVVSTPKPEPINEPPPDDVPPIGSTSPPAKKHAPRVSIETAEEFIGRYNPIDYLIEGLLIRGYLYGLTSRPNHGKTTVATAIAMHVANGRRLAGMDVSAGRVLMMYGENADNSRLMLIAAAQEFGADTEDMDIISTAGQLESLLDDIADGCRDRQYALVVVDSSASYFSGVKEDDNVQAGDHARALRKLTQLPGNPAVMALCHPTKYADKDNLMPRGGSAFLAELDTNLTLWTEAGVAEVSHNKVRGPVIDQFSLELKPVTLSGYQDQKGRPIVAPVAVPMSDVQAQEAHKARIQDDDRLLHAMLHFPNASFAEWAHSCHWTAKDGKPAKYKVDRAMKRLIEDKLVRRYRGGYVLTATGKDEAKGIA